MRTTVLAPDGRTEVEVPEMDDGFTGAAELASVPRLTMTEWKAQAIRLATEKHERAMRVLALATREAREAELALHDLRGLDTPHTRWLRAFLENDAAAMHRAHVECAAQDFLRTHLQPPQDIAEEVTAEVARIRNEQEQEKPCCRLPASQGGCR